MAISFKTLNSLLKLHKQKLDQLIGEVQKAQNKLQALHTEIEMLNQQITQESAYIEKSATLHYLRQISANYFAVKHKELTTILAERNSHEEYMIKLQETLKEAYQEFKKYEIIKEAQEKAQQIAVDKADAAELEVFNQTIKKGR